MAKEKTCAITRSDWDKGATPALAKEMAAEIAAKLLPLLAAKVFGTGSFGVYVSDKITVTIAGKPVTFQTSILGTVVNSKEAK